jgi:hypothetical protein
LLLLLSFSLLDVGNNAGCVRVVQWYHNNRILVG